VHDDGRQALRRRPPSCVPRLQFGGVRTVASVTMIAELTLHLYSAFTVSEKPVAAVYRI